jgi:photosynthetic reaction center H subunit
MTGTFFGNFDLAQLALYSFWLFFAGLVIYLQRENQREGYPTENEDGSSAGATFGMPSPKTFILPHGRGTLTVPNPDQRETRTFAMAPTSPSAGSPYEPTGNPMLDGVGPAAYAMRRDEPELDSHGRPSIEPLRFAEGFKHFAGKDPRGLPVIAGDDEIAGTVSDMWIDTGELMVRYLEIDLGGGDTRLVPITLAKITWRGVRVQSIFAEHFKSVPKTKSDHQVTKLEEDKICAFYAGGKLYASQERLDSQLDPMPV